MKGLKFMIEALFGDNSASVAALQRGIGQKITALILKDDGLYFTFEDGYHMRLFDDGQDCCEHRYMTTDDELADFIGAVLMTAEVREAPNVPDEWGEHEVAFLVVTTSIGAFTCETHNEHNGYYGGFVIKAEELADNDNQ